MMEQAHLALLDFAYKDHAWSDHLDIWQSGWMNRRMLHHVGVEMDGKTEHNEDSELCT